MRTAFRTTLIFTIALLLLGGVLLNLMNPDGSARAAGQANHWPQTDGIPIQEQPGEPVAKVHHLGQFGPQICVPFGDPFSPLNSPYMPGLYTYQYEILIPPDYETRYGTSVVRVELLDPDSINGPDQTAVITHTQAWLELNPSEPITQTASCIADQTDPCAIETCEWDQAQGNHSFSSVACSQPVPALSDKTIVNPTWVVRLDENRGNGDGSGDGTCGHPVSYTIAYNTSTLFELYYYRGGSLRTPLASYTGQSGNKTTGMLNTDFDAWDHGTDLRWVSPGADNDFGNVPTDCGSPTGGYLDGNNPSRCPAGPDDTLPGSGRGFEIDLNVDTVDLLPDRHGFRSLFVGVTTTGGSSENGFSIWAGPPSAVSGLSSDINLRHLALTNDRYNGIIRDNTARVLAVDAMPINMMSTFTVSFPLQLTTQYDSVRAYRFSFFDIDSLSRPPLFFYHNQVDRTDFEIEITPDCFINSYSCHNQWFGENFVSGGGGEGGDSPVIRLPENAPDGRLMAQIQAGYRDSFVVLVDKRPLNMLLIPVAMHEESSTIDLAWNHPAGVGTHNLYCADEPYEEAAGATSRFTTTVTGTQTISTTTSQACSTIGQPGYFFARLDEGDAAPAETQTLGVFPFEIQAGD